MSGTARPRYAIEASGLRKSFGSTLAVDGVNLAVPQGIVYVLLGPGGAGKTTTVRMLTTLLRPDGGTARVFGHDVVAEPEAVRGRIGLTGQFGSVDEERTGRENLLLLGRSHGRSPDSAQRRADLLLEVLLLTEAADHRVGTYSGGMRRRLDIAAGLVTTPDVLCLDEPTTGLDPRGRDQVWALVRALVAGGTTVLLTTRSLDEADQLADRMAVFDHGRVIAEGTGDELKSAVDGGVLHVRLWDAAQRAHARELLATALGTEVRPGADPTSLCALVTEEACVGPALARLSEAGIETPSFSLGQPGLADVFLALTRMPSRAAG
ncbi:ATP-binding cassette domain-containing protein [Amycolatopsis aidingensis]|uniref:ATP-binding cassette domain-containing protein n=1 Tax=Amycolatopsis aidingensis TaxID=2842453 RepID=UPI001C0E8DFC|nr:ATP-binding cassette domain-containing protein [Amycolatopsis aidingensis]